MADKKKTPFYLIDPDSDFYRPIATRLIICIAVTIWAAVEIYNGDGFWGFISGAAAVYCIYVLIVSYKEPPPKPVVPAQTRRDDGDDDDNEEKPQA